MTCNVFRKKKAMVSYTSPKEPVKSVVDKAVVASSHSQV